MGADKMFDPIDSAEVPQAEAEEWRPMLAPTGAKQEDLRHPTLGDPLETWKYHNAKGLLEGYVCRFETIISDGTPSKEFRPRRYGALVKNGKTSTGWHWKGWGENRPLYGLCDLLARSDASVIVVEGEKKVEAARLLFPDHVTVSPMNGAKSAQKTDWSPLAGREVVAWPDHDRPGHEFAEAVVKLAADAGAASVAIVAIPAEWPAGWDLADDLPDGVGHELLVKMLKLAKPRVWSKSSSRPKARRKPASEDEIRTEVCRLVTLSPVKYELEREDVAEKLSIRMSVLDRLVKIERGDRDVVRGDEKAAGGSGRPLEFREIDPWPEPVDGAELLAGVKSAVRRYVVLEDTEADAVALWVVATHAFDTWRIFPRLFITAPEKGCGKTTLLDAMFPLVPRPLIASNIKAAAVFRVIELARPTLFLDEADAYARNDEDLRSVLDAGHHRDGAVIRCVGNDYEPRQFSVWAPAALAAIGRLPGTIEDRSIIVRLRRRRPDETIESLDEGRLRDLEDLARKVARWVADHHEAIARAKPEIPSVILNRAADNWRPLLAIAKCASDSLYERARNAAVELTGGDTGCESARILLLGDLKELFDAKGAVLFTKEIIEDLVQRDDQPWSEWKNGKPITPRQIAALLKPLGITTNQTVRRGSVTEKGYRAEWFADAFARYISPRQSVTRSQAPNSVALDDFPSVTPKQVVTDTISKKPNISAGCDRATDRNPASGGKRANGADFDARGPASDIPATSERLPWRGRL